MSNYPNSRAIDKALIAILSGDAQLKALLPDGVFRNEGPPGIKRFVLFGVQDSLDRGTYGGVRAVEEKLFFVKGVALSTLNVDMSAVCARIDALLGDEPTLPPPVGYRALTAYRDEDQPIIDDTEVDDVDASIRWFHAGARYWLVATI